MTAIDCGSMRARRRFERSSMWWTRSVSAAGSCSSTSRWSQTKGRSGSASPALQERESLWPHWSPGDSQYSRLRHGSRAGDRQLLCLLDVAAARPSRSEAHSRSSPSAPARPEWLVPLGSPLSVPAPRCTQSRDRSPRDRAARCRAAASEKKVAATASARAPVSSRARPASRTRSARSGACGICHLAVGRSSDRTVRLKPG